MKILVVNKLAPAVGRALAMQARDVLATLALAALPIASAATVAVTPRPALAADAKADELPQNTNQIESLTPEQARKLAAEFQGVEVEIEFKGHGKVKVGGCLPLNGLESLDADAAKALAAFKGQGLYLNGLTSLSDDAAKALAAFKGEELSLNGLTTLSADAVEALVEFKGQLSLEGLTTLSDEAAKALAESLAESEDRRLSLGILLSRLGQTKSLTPETARLVCAYTDSMFEVSFSGLTALDTPDAVEIAKILATVNRRLSLPSLRKISPDAAKALAEFQGEELSLGGPPTLDAETARLVCACAKADLRVSLAGLIAIDIPDAVEAAKILATAKGHLALPNLKYISADAAKALAEFKGRGLSLNGLTTLSDDAAQALAEFKGQQLYLNGLTTLSDDAAQALAEFKGTYLYLNGLTTLDADAAKALAEFKGGWLFLHNFMIGLGQAESLTPETARLVCACARTGSGVRLSGLDTIDAVEIAKILATAQGWLSLPSLKNISTEAAKAFAAFKGQALSLDGLTTLDADAAKALAECKGQRLSLNGLTTLDADAARALVEFKGDWLFVDGLTTLSAETARLVCACAKPGSGASLSGLIALDTPDAVEIAKILATAKGHLALPNLKKISPKTLTALIEKTDVMIPPLATLELIPEPDGSLTEDFIIPEGFEKR